MYIQILRKIVDCELWSFMVEAVSKNHTLHKSTVACERLIVSFCFGWTISNFTLAELGHPQRVHVAM